MLGETKSKNSTPPEYDPRIDGFLSWQLAIKEFRKRGVIEGRFEPRNAEEEEWIRQHEAP